MKRFLLTDNDEEDTDETTSGSKRAKEGSKGHHAVGYNAEWELEFPWLVSVKDECGKITGMLCRVCKRHKTTAKYNKSTVWSTTPCTCIRKDSVRRHSQSLQHKGGMEKEMLREQSSCDGGIRQAFQTQLSLSEAAVKTAMQCLYWLVKEEIPHTTNYPSLLQAMEYMGCVQLKHLKHGENAKYTSRRIVMEFLQVMGNQVEQQTLDEMLASPVYSLLIDETTDVSILSEMVIYARYIDVTATARTVFLKIAELPNGSAETIESVLLAYLADHLIPLSRLVGFGSDGAAVMIGKHTGVATRLKNRQPILTSIHCLAHRLALAASQAGGNVKFINDTFKPTLRQLFYFYENSPVRSAGLKAIQDILKTPEIKLKKPLDTRWLSHDNACQTLRKILPAVISSLEREAEERGEALAVGLSRVVQQYNFVASLYMMCDALPKVSRLSRIFQLSGLNMSEVHSHVTTATEGLATLIDDPMKGEHFRSLTSDLESDLAPYNIPHPPEVIHAFLKNIQKPFLSALIENIKERLPDTKFFSNFDIFNPLNLPSTSDDMLTQNYGEEAIDKLAKHYGSGDSPFLCSADLRLEWLDYRTNMIRHCTKMSMKEHLSSLALHKGTVSVAYPNLSKVAQVFLALPVSTADCERGFSTMKRIKTRLRSQMINETLNHCMRISMEAPPLEQFDFDTSVNSWSGLKNRRIS